MACKFLFVSHLALKAVYQLPLCIQFFFCVFHDEVMPPGGLEKVIIVLSYSQKLNVVLILSTILLSRGLKLIYTNEMIRWWFVKKYFHICMCSV